MFRRAFLLLLVSATFSGPAAATESALSLRWALGAWSGDGESPEALLRDTPLEPGTRLKFLVEPMAPSKIYLLLWDTDENVHVLYRHDGDDRPTYIPPGE
ncbi:MAG: hypothetical protein GY723_10845, partial [bacterium]|nr:hypothetical protein [bacterium]